LKRVEEVERVERVEANSSPPWRGQGWVSKMKDKRQKTKVNS
jgi:hypothetical protein